MIHRWYSNYSETLTGADFVFADSQREELQYCRLLLCGQYTFLYSNWTNNTT